MDEKEPMADIQAPSDTAADKKRKRSKWLSWASYIAIPLAIYFGNVEFQSYLGRQALEETGLELLSLEQAISKAKVENKLVLADMSAIWCPSCRKLDQEVLSKQAVKDAIEKNYIFSRTEYESKEGEKLMEKYNVRGFPTILVLDDSGKLVQQIPLTFDPEKFISLINQQAKG